MSAANNPNVSSFKTNISSLSKIIDNQSSRLQDDNLNIEELCQIQRELARNYNERGFNFYHDVEFDKAVDDYTRSISYANCDKCEVDVDTIGVAYYNRGTVKYRMSNFVDAVDDFKKAVVFNSDNKEFQLGLEAAMKQRNAKI